MYEISFNKQSLKKDSVILISQTLKYVLRSAHVKIKGHILLEIKKKKDMI